jgi:hypothetical protein
MPNPRQKPVRDGHDPDAVNFRSLVEFVKKAHQDLVIAGDHDAALRFEIFHQYLVNDFRGGWLTYRSRALGL